MISQLLTTLEDEFRTKWGAAQARERSSAGGVTTIEITGSSGPNTMNICTAVATLVLEDKRPVALDLVLMTVEVGPYRDNGSDQEARDSKVGWEKRRWEL